MKKLKIVSFLIAVLVVGAIGYYFTNLFLNGSKPEVRSIADQVKENPPNESNSVKENVEGTESALTRSNSEGTIAIKTTLLAEKSNSNKLVFEVVMNTHAGDLTQYDLTKLASISFGIDTNNSGIFEWEPSNNDSHHMMGTLIWNGVLDKNLKNINLNLNNIDNIPSQKFTWEKSNLINDNFNN
jgi:hypothetical protein